MVPTAAPITAVVPAPAPIRTGDISEVPQATQPEPRSAIPKPLKLLTRCEGPVGWLLRAYRNSAKLIPASTENIMRVAVTGSRKKKVNELMNGLRKKLTFWLAS